MKTQNSGRGSEQCFLYQNGTLIASQPPSFHSLFSLHLTFITPTSLSGNPLCREPDYRSYVVYHLRKLNVLDGAPFDAAEQAAARDRYDGRVTYEFLMDRIGGGSGGGGGQNQQQPTRPFETLVELDLSNARLRSAEGFEGAARLTALRCVVI